jgi:outer membrane protein assembly factor BamB
MIKQKPLQDNLESVQRLRWLPPRTMGYLAFFAIIMIVLAGLAIPPLLSHAANSTASATTDDWPTYLHDIQRTAASADTTFSTANITQLVNNWSFKTGGVVESSPTVVAGTVYVASWDGYEYALDAKTGAQKWKTYLGITNASPICNPPTLGVSSAATVQNNVVYLGGGDSYWYALDATTGAILWKVYTGDNSAAGGHYNWSSPLIYNGYAYIGVASLGDCPLVQGQLIQVNLSTHQIAQTLDLVPTGQIGGGIWTTPSIDTATNTIYVSTATENLTTQAYAQAMVAINATTMAITSSWKLPENEAVTDSDFSTSPTLFSSSTGTPMVVSINKNGYAYAFNRSNLAAGPLWQTRIADGGDCPVPCGNASVSSGTFANGVLYLAGEDTVINGVGYKGSVNALNPDNGQMLWQHGAAGPVIGALAYANGLIIDGAGSVLEVLDASTGKRLASYATGGWLYTAPSVAEGQIYVGGVDTHVYAFGLGAIPIPPPPDPNCPANWACQDVGTPTPAGSETVSNGTWTVKAGGAGIAGTSDQFRLMTQNVSGDTQVVARVASQQTTAAAAQAGLLVRQNNTPGSPYYGVFLTKGKGVIVQYRTAWGGTTTTDVQLTTATAPLYLEIQRVGDNFQAATSPDGVTYTLVPGGTASVVMPNAVLAGLATSSATSGTLDTVTYDHVAIGAPTTAPHPTPPPTPCPANWSCQDIGDPALVGDQTLNNGVWTLKGAGTGIGGYGDQFHYVWQSWTGDVALTAHIASQANTSGNDLAGLMLRQDTGTDTPYYGAFVTPGNGIQVQYRSPDGPDSVLVTTVNGAAPTYLEVARSGNSFSTYTSSDGKNWTYVPGTSITLDLPTAILSGIAVTSAQATTTGQAGFDTVTMNATAPPPPTLCPSGWSCNDIGFPTPAGDQNYNAGTWTVDGGGGDIWNTVDQFHYVSQFITGDGSVSAHVVSQTNSDPFAKAGVMLRQNTNDDAPFYDALVTPGNGILVQYRTASSAEAASAASIAGTVPTYLEVSKVGTTFTAYTSPDGINWTAVPGSSVTLSMTGPIQGGIAVTSHNTTTLSTVVFDSVNVSGASASVCPTNWNCADIGATGLTGSQTVNGNTWTMQAGGGDIWGTSDEFHYIWQSLATDGSISAHVTSQTNTDPWAKAGVMLRQSTDPGSAYYDVMVTPGNGVVVQYRTTVGANAAMAASMTGTVPQYLQVTKVGTTFTAYTSPNGITWTAVPGSSVTLSMSGTVLAGVAATSHDIAALSAVTLDTINVGASTSTCPTNWNCADIGATGLAGSQTVNGNAWTVQAAGGDIWGTSDEFHYIWQSLATDGSISVHVASQTNTDPWAKAGVMLRQSTDPGDVFYDVLVTPGNGIVVQYRTTIGANAAMAASVAGTVPQYLQVTKVGTTFTAYTSLDGNTWTAIPGSSVTLSMTGPILAGVAATSHNVGALSTVVVDSANIGTPTNNCPTNWNCADIGHPGLAGSQVYDGGTWTMQGSGGDIWGTSDQFRYAWQSLTANGSVSAHVVSQTNTNSWAKAGVMLRQSSDPASPFYDLVVTPANGITVQYRTTSGGSAASAVITTGTTPAYFKVNRVGTTFTAYTSPDGVNWTAIAGSSETLNITGTIDAGIVDTSHDNGQLSTAVFDTAVIGAP